MENLTSLPKNDDALNIVIIGMGGHAGSWRRSIEQHPGFKLTAIVDIDTELMEHMGQFGLTQEDFFVSIDDLVEDRGKPDVAVIATPIYTHHVLVKETMDLGINVICEKNMASTIYQGRQMVQCAIDHPELATSVGQQYRYFGKNFLVKDYIKNHNELGKLAFIRLASAGSWGEKRRGWRRFLPEVYLEDMCPHWFDLFRYWTGLDPVQVYADAFIPRYSKWSGSSTCFVNVALSDPENVDNRHEWVWGQIYGDWQSRGPKTPDKNYQRLLFEKGEIQVDDAWIKIIKYLDDEGTKIDEDAYLMADAGNDGVEHMGTNFEGQCIILEQVKRCIESHGQNQPLNSFQSIFKSFAISMGAIESSRTGKVVHVADYWKDMKI
jgi:predicted dehydrogenase